MKKPSLILLATSLILGVLAAPVSFAQTGLTPHQLIERMARPAQSRGFSGKRFIKVTRGQENPLVSAAEVRFADRRNYDFTLTSPASLNGIRFAVLDGVSSAYFPNERLAFANFAFELPGRFVLSLSSQRLDLLEQNYQIWIANQNEDFNGRATYHVSFIPKHRIRDQNGHLQPLAPRRHLWLDHETMNVLREARFWDWVNDDGSWNYNQNPFADLWYESYYSEFNPQIEAVSSQAKKLMLSGQDNNTALSYSSVAEAESRESVRIPRPSYLPRGFVLKDIQVFKVFGQRVQVQNYTDGMNDLMISFQPEANVLATLFDKDFNMNLIQRVTDLSQLAPNNYFTAPFGSGNVTVFGDVMPIELQRVAGSLS